MLTYAHQVVLCVGEAFIPGREGPGWGTPSSTFVGKAFYPTDQAPAFAAKGFACCIEARHLAGDGKWFAGLGKSLANLRQGWVPKNAEYQPYFVIFRPGSVFFTQRLCPVLAFFDRSYPAGQIVAGEIHSNGKKYTMRKS